MKYGTRSIHSNHSGIRLDQGHPRTVPPRPAASRIPHWRGVFMIALLCTLAGCGDGDSSPAGNIAAARASAPASTSAPVVHCATACH